MSTTGPDTTPDTLPPNANNGHGTALATVPDSRRADGRFAPGNQVRVTHGGRRRKALAAPENSELYQQAVADLGADLSALELAVLRRVAEADAIAQSAFNYLARSRESISSKRMQSALQTHATALQAMTRAAALLGLKRRAKHVDPLQAVRDAVARANAKTGQ